MSECAPLGEPLFSILQHIMNNENKPTQAFDPLDMNNYRIEKLPKMKKSGFERVLQRIGAPLAILAFILLYWVVDLPFVNRIDTNKETTTLTSSAVKRYDQLAETAMQQITAEQTEKTVTPQIEEQVEDAAHNKFIRINYAMLAIFVAAIILWITEAIPNYLTSLMVILGIVLTNITTDKTAYAQNAGGIMISFIIINLVLSAFISATTAKAAILLPIFMVVAAIYGATGGEHRNNFGRNLILQNLFQINLGANAFLTGSGATLLAGSLIAGAMGIGSFSYQDWFKAAFPMNVLLILIAWFVGTKIFFPLKKEERVPQIAGGMERLREELNKLGKMKPEEWKSVAIFVVVLILWATDKQHGINQTAVAFMGAVVALLPGIGVVKWNDVDIPWHLLLFSAGAYTLGAGLDATGLPGTLIDALFSNIGITQETPFWVLYLILTAGMLLFSLVFQSKTMLTLIFVPIAIGVAQKNGYPIMSLAFPVAMLVGHVYVLPFNSKPAALLYTTNQYSWSDTFKFGITMMFISWLMIILWGETVLKWFGYTNGVF